MPGCIYAHTHMHLNTCMGRHTHTHTHKFVPTNRNVRLEKKNRSSGERKFPKASSVPPTTTRLCL